MSGSTPANVGAPNVPRGSSLEEQSFYIWCRNQIVALQAAVLPPTTPSNIRATALAGAIQVDFTRSDGDSYVLYWNTTPSINQAVRIDLGTANKYVDDIGQGGVKRYYAIRAKKGPVNGDVSPWISTTTLALGTPVAPPTPPPATETPFVDQETNSIAQHVIDKDAFYPI